MLVQDQHLLVPEADIASLAHDNRYKAAHSACVTIAEWARTFLTRSNSLLGREGPVCPFTQPSLNKHLFWLAPYLDITEDGSAVEAAVKVYLDWFLALDPVSGPDKVYKTILIIFPTLNSKNAASILQPLQHRLKPEFVKQGLMVGQFFEGCDEPGLWNAAFRPLQSPLPLLAIRHMVPSDFPFLHGSRGSAEMLASYFTQFGNTIPPAVRTLIVKALFDFENTHPEEFRS